MKKLVYVLVLLLGVAVFAACGPEKDETSEPEESSGVEEVQPVEPQQSTAANNGTEIPEPDPEAPLGSLENPIAEMPVDPDDPNTPDEHEVTGGNDAPYIPEPDPNAPLGSPENPIAEELQG